MLFKILAMSSINNNHDKWNPTSLTLDDAKTALRNIGNNIKSFATGVVDKIGGGIRSIKEKSSEIKADALTKLSQTLDNMATRWETKHRSVVLRPLADGAARMSMNHYREKLEKDLTTDDAKINLELYNALTNLCNNKDLTIQEKIKELKLLCSLSKNSEKGDKLTGYIKETYTSTSIFTQEQQNHIETIDNSHEKQEWGDFYKTTNSIENKLKLLGYGHSTITTIMESIQKFGNNENYDFNKLNLFSKILDNNTIQNEQYAIELAKKTFRTTSPTSNHKPAFNQKQFTTPSTNPTENNSIENTSQESSADLSNLTETQQNAINNFTENPNQQSSVAQSAKKTPPPLPSIPQKKEPPQLPPKPNAINQQPIQEDAKPVMQSPEQPHVAPIKQPPKPPTKALPQPPHPKTDPQQPTSSAPQTSTQSAVEENKTAETTSTSHSDPKKTTISFIKKIKSKFSSGGNKPTKTDTTSQDSEPKPITQDMQNKLDNLLKKLDSLQESEKTTELANYLKVAENSGFEETAKAMLTYVTNELEKIPTEETPKINNEPSTGQPKDLTEMIKNGLKNITETTENDQNNNEISLKDLEKKISLLNSKDDNFYKSYLEIVEKMQDWLEDNIAQDDKNYDNIKKEIDNVLTQRTNDEKLKALRKALEILKNPNEQNLDQG